MTEKYQYYSFDYKGIRIDPYRVMHQYGMTHPAQQHAFKKLLRAGTGHKSLEQDIQEVIDTLVRWQGMIEEDKDDTSSIN